MCRYLFFYSETLELLLRSGVLTPDQMGLSVVSEAISDLWRSLPPERRAEAQQHVLDQNSVSWEGQTGITASVLTCLNQSASHVFEEVSSEVHNLGLFRMLSTFLISFLSYKWLLMAQCLIFFSPFF